MLLCEFKGSSPSAGVCWPKRVTHPVCEQRIMWWLWTHRWSVYLSSHGQSKETWALYWLCKMTNTRTL